LRRRAGAFDPRHPRGLASAGATFFVPSKHENRKPTASAIGGSKDPCTK
jgi:hypothetical protein